MAPDSDAEEQAGKSKYAFVVKLNDEDRKRLEYLSDMTNLPKTTVVRILLRQASEGILPDKNVTFNFTPFSQRGVEVQAGEGVQKE